MAGVSPSRESDWSTRGPPRALPKADERMAPQTPGKTSHAPRTAILTQMIPGSASSSGVTLAVMASSTGMVR